MTNIRLTRTQAVLAFSPRAVSSSGLVTIAVDTATDGAILELGNGITLQGIKITDAGGIEVNSVAGYQEMSVYVRCRSGNEGTIAHLDSGMSAAHKIRVVETAANLTVTADSWIQLVYSATEGQWLAYDLQRDLTAPVTSVNGDTGDVTLDAADVGADASGTATAAVAAHIAAGDPHTQYTTAAEAAAAAPVQSVAGKTGVVTLNATDVGADASGTAATAVSNHVAASNPHTQYTRSLRYSGTTAGSGTYSATFGAAFSNTPNVQANIIGGTFNQFAVVTSRSTTGFTVTAYTRNSINLLGSEVLLASTSTTNSLTIDVLVTSND